MVDPNIFENSWVYLMANGFQNRNNELSFYTFKSQISLSIFPIIFLPRDMYIPRQHYVVSRNPPTPQIFMGLYLKLSLEFGERSSKEEKILKGILPLFFWFLWEDERKI